MVTKPPAIFYSPHADDSVLSMSTDILQHIDAGRDIYLVLASLGASKYMLDVLNGFADTYEYTRHNPELEGYRHIPVTFNDVKQIRLNEFNSEVGVYRHYAANRVSVKSLCADYNEGFNLDQAKRAIAQMEEAYPGASHKVMTYHDSHSDHQTFGLAARDLKTQGAISDVRYYIKHDDRSRVGRLVNVMVNTATPRQKTAVERATRPFRAWNPAGGSYAFGYHSVTPTFNALIEKPDCHVHA